MTRPEPPLITMSSQKLVTQGRVQLTSLLHQNKELGPMDARVVSKLPLGVDMILGLPVMLRVGCWIGQVNGKHTVRWGQTLDGNSSITSAAGVSSHSVTRAKLPSRRSGENATDREQTGPESVKPSTRSTSIKDVDFNVDFRGNEWVVRWNWKCDPPKQEKSINYHVAEKDRPEFDQEIQSWIQEGVLVEHNQSVHGRVSFYLPLMAVRQLKGDESKVRPVLDYRRLNKCIESHPGQATPLCADRVREWRQMGKSWAILDLRRAYLQVRVHRELWTYQAVRWHGRTYLLTRLGFGLASAPKIMTAIVEKALSMEPIIHASVSSYIDDLFVAEELVSADAVKSHLSSWGLESKPPQRLTTSSAVRVLGLKVNNDSSWRRDKPLLQQLEFPLTRRQVHKIVGEWLGHFPVAGWLRVVCAMIQRQTAIDGTGWGEAVGIETEKMLNDALELLKTQGDPVRGVWQVDAKSPMTIWADASSIAIGVSLEINGDVVEDASWLRPKNDSAHINVSELDAAIRGINLALRWGKRDFLLITDSATVYGWLKAVIDRSHNIRTRALSEILIRRRLDTLQQIIAQEELKIRVRLVESSKNRADRLTRIPSKSLMRSGKTCMAAVTPNNVTLEDIKSIHEKCHFGVDRSLELAREKFGNGVSRRMVRRVVNRCDVCARVDPAIKFRWDHGSVKASNTWQRLAVDITHVNTRPYLTIIDTASGFNIWRKLHTESAEEICKEVQAVFCQFGAPESIMSDNGTNFQSVQFRKLLQKWDVSQEFSCAYRPQGNGAIERAHRSVKRTVTRSGMTADEAVFWLNNTHGKKTASPFERVFAAVPRKPGVAHQRIEIHRSEHSVKETEDKDNDRNPFSVGDRVYLRPPDGKCDQSWSGPHTVTNVRSNVAVVLNDDGRSRHVSFLRKVPRPLSCQAVPSSSDDTESEESRGGDDDSENADTKEQPRRSRRIKRRPEKLKDYEVKI